MNNWYPNFSGQNPSGSDLDYAFRQAFNAIYSAQNNLKDVADKISAVTEPGKSNPQTFLHEEDRAAIATILQINGTNPLNVQGLLGQLSQPQKAMVSVIASTSSSSSVGPAVPGQLLIQGGQLFVFEGSPVGAYVPVAADAVALFDTHANRVANFNPANYPNGSIFWETDRGVYYINLSATWTYSTGIMEDVFANQPSDLGSADVNFLFLATDTKIYYYWDGSAWNKIPINTATPGTYGDGTHTTVIVVDVNGRISSITSTAITFPSTTGFTGTATVRNSAGTGTSSFTFSNGLCTGFTP